MRHHNDDGVVEELAERLGAALVTTATGRGSVDEDHERFCGLAGLYAHPAVADLLGRADLIVGLGTRMEETARLGWQPADGCQLVQVTLDPLDACVPGTLHVLGDAAAAARTWSDGAADARRPDEDWSAAVLAARATAMLDAAARCDEGAPALRVVDVLAALRRSCPLDTVLVQENGLQDMWSYLWPYWNCGRSGGSVVPSEQTSLGFGAAGALGVALADPSRTVVAFVGDGAFGMLGADVQTVADAGARILYVVLRNGGYGWLQAQLDQSGLAAGGARFVDERLAAAPLALPPGVEHVRIRARGDVDDGVDVGLAAVAQGRLAVLDCAVRLADTPPGVVETGAE